MHNAQKRRSKGTPKPTAKIQSTMFWVFAAFEKALSTSTSKDSPIVFIQSDNAKLKEQFEKFKEKFNIKKPPKNLKTALDILTAESIKEIDKWIRKYNELITIPVDPNLTALNYFIKIYEEHIPATSHWITKNLELALWKGCAYAFRNKTNGVITKTADTKRHINFEIESIANKDVNLPKNYLEILASKSEDVRKVIFAYIEIFQDLYRSAKEEDSLAVKNFRKFSAEFKAKFEDEIATYNDIQSIITEIKRSEPGAKLDLSRPATIPVRRTAVSPSSSFNLGNFNSVTSTDDLSSPTAGFSGYGMMIAAAFRATVPAPANIRASAAVSTSDDPRYNRRSANMTIVSPAPIIAAISTKGAISRKPTIAALPDSSSETGAFPAPTIATTSTADAVVDTTPTSAATVPNENIEPPQTAEISIPNTSVSTPTAPSMVAPVAEEGSESADARLLLDSNDPFDDLGETLRSFEDSKLGEEPKPDQLEEDSDDLNFSCEYDEEKGKNHNTSPPPGGDDLSVLSDDEVPLNFLSEEKTDLADGASTTRNNSGRSSPALRDGNIPENDGPLLGEDFLSTLNKEDTDISPQNIGVTQPNGNNPSDANNPKKLEVHSRSYISLIARWAFVSTCVITTSLEITRAITKYSGISVLNDPIAQGVTAFATSIAAFFAVAITPTEYRKLTVAFLSATSLSSMGYELYYKGADIGSMFNRESIVGAILVPSLVLIKACCNNNSQDPGKE